MNQDRSLPKLDTNETDPFNFYDTEGNEVGFVENTPPIEEQNRPPTVLLVIIGIVILGIVVFIILLFSTGSGQEVVDPTNVETPDQVINPPISTEPVTLRVWGAFLEPEVVQPLITQYQELNPNVTIEYIDKIAEYGNVRFDVANSNYQEDLDRVIASPTSDVIDIPDIFMVDNSWVGRYENFITYAPSTSALALNFEQSYYPAVASDFAFNSGSIAGIPLWIDNLVILYNRDILAQRNIQEPPASWEEFSNIAEELTVFDNGIPIQAGFAAGETANVSFWYEILNVLLLQNDASIRFLGTPSNIYSISNNGRAAEAFNFYTSFSETTTQSQATWSPNFKNESAEFLEGDVAMIVSTSWRYREILKFNEDLGLNIDIGVAQLPTFDGQLDPNINFADYWGFMVSRNRPNTSASWSFLEWLSEDEQLRTLHEQVKNVRGYFGTLYPKSSLQSELNEDEFLRVFNRSLPSTQSWYQINGEDARQNFTTLLGEQEVNVDTIIELLENLNLTASTLGLL